MNYGPKTLDEHIEHLARAYGQLAVTVGIESKIALKCAHMLSVWKAHRRVLNLLKGK